MVTASAPFPAARFRRMRAHDSRRRLMRENTLTVDDFIWPVFIRDGENDETPIASMPGVSRLTVDRVVRAAEEAASLGIPAICLFPYTAAEDRTED